MDGMDAVQKSTPAHVVSETEILYVPTMTSTWFSIH